MRKKEVRDALKTFWYGSSKGKYGVIERLWNKALVIVPETIVWALAVISNNWAGILIVHLLVFVTGLFMYIFIAKGR